MARSSRASTAAPAAGTRPAMSIISGIRAQQSSTTSQPAAIALTCGHAWQVRRPGWRGNSSKTYEWAEREEDGHVERGDDENNTLRFCLDLWAHGEVADVEFRGLRRRPLFHVVVGDPYVLVNGAEVPKLRF